MDIFQLATRLVTTGEEQTAQALKRVELVGTSAAGNITAAWAGVNFAPTTRSAAMLADVSGNLAAQIRLATSAATQQLTAVQNLGSALQTIDASQLRSVEQEMLRLQERITALQSTKLPGGNVSGFASVAVAELGVLQNQLATTRATFLQMGGAIAPAGQAMEEVSGKSTKLASIFDKLQKVLFIVGSSSAGLPPKFSKLGFALLSLGAGGAVVAAVTVGMALIGNVMQKAADRAEAEAKRVTATVDKWQKRMDDLSGRSARIEIEDLTKTVDDLTKALEAAYIQQRIVTQGTPTTNPIVAQQDALVRAAQQKLREAQAAVRKAQEHPDTGPGSQQAEDERKRKIDEQRSAYERYLGTLVRGVAIDRTRGAATTALQQEEDKLAHQLENTKLSLEERIRLTGLLLEAQKALGTLPETDEQRAQAAEKVRASYDQYLQTLTAVVEAEASRPSAITELNTALDRTRALLALHNLDLDQRRALYEQLLVLEARMAEAQRLSSIPAQNQEALADAYNRTRTALQNVNLSLEEQLRLRTQLAQIETAMGAVQENHRAEQQALQVARTNEQIRAMMAGLNTDLILIQSNTNAMLEQMGLKLSQSAMNAWEQVRNVMLEAPADALNGAVEGLAAGLTQRNAKAGDMILASLGSIFTRMGEAMIKAGITLTGLWKAIASFGPQSGPALIAAGVILAGLGKALGAAAAGAAGGGGGGAAGSTGQSFAGYRNNEERIVRIIVNPPSGTTTAPALTPAAPMNFTIIGPADPLAQRAISQLVTAARARGLPA